VRRTEIVEARAEETTTRVESRGLQRGGGGKGGKSKLGKKEIRGGEGAIGNCKGPNSDKNFREEELHSVFGGGIYKQNGKLKTLGKVGAFQVVEKKSPLEGPIRVSPTFWGGGRNRSGEK